MPRVPVRDVIEARVRPQSEDCHRWDENGEGDAEVGRRGRLDAECVRGERRGADDDDDREERRRRERERSPRVELVLLVRDVWHAPEFG